MSRYIEPRTKYVYMLNHGTWNRDKEVLGNLMRGLPGGLRKQGRRQIECLVMWVVIC